MCFNDSDCNNHGNCENSSCTCDLGYIGSKCEVLQEYLGLPYLIFYYIICLMNVIILALALWKVYLFVQSWLKRRQFGIRHISMFVLSLGVSVRTIHFLLMVDQHWTRAPQTTFFFLYPCLLVSYACELVLWFELYTNTTLQNIERLPKYRTVLLILNIFIFPVEFGVRIPSEIIKTGPIPVLLFIIWLIYMMVIVLVELVAFLCIGYRLIKKVQQMQSITGKEAQKKAFLKLSRTMTILTVIMLIAIAALVALLIATNPWVWFGLFILCRLLEFAVILVLLYLVKAPTPPESDTAVLETSEGGIPSTKAISLTLTRSATANSDEKDHGSASS